VTKPIITQRAKPISVTLGEDLIDALDKRCKADATTRSDIARESIAAYLDRPDLVPVLPRGRQPAR